MTVTWSAPGRVNLIGEHIDYNGGPVLPFAIDRCATVSVAPRSDATIHVRSEGLGTSTLSPMVQKGDVDGWERYVAASIWAYTEASSRPLPGLDIDISSTVPLGAGLSSSAALECAVICALDAFGGSGLGRRDIAELAVRAEREFVGVPCGPMDQLAVMLSTADHALLVDTRTLATDQVPLRLASRGLTLLVVDTRVRHALDDGAYADRQSACARAAAELGLTYLCEATTSQVLGLRDPMLRRRAHHVVSEAERVRDVVALLRAGRPCDIGGLLTASHQSLADDYEVSCPELDTAVDAALAAGALGARMTGGGFGGSAIALCRTPEAVDVTASIHNAFHCARFQTPEVWPVTPQGGASRV